MLSARSLRHLNLALTNDIATTPEISMGGSGSMLLAIPTGYTSATLSFYAQVGGTYTFVPLYTAAGVAVTLAVVAERAYPVPAEVNGLGVVKIVTNQAGNNAKKIGITLKS